MKLGNIYSFNGKQYKLVYADVFSVIGSTCEGCDAYEFCSEMPDCGLDGRMSKTAGIFKEVKK